MAIATPTRRRHRSPRPRPSGEHDARAEELRARRELAQALARMERTYAFAVRNLEEFEAYLNGVRQRLRTFDQGARRPRGDDVFARAQNDNANRTSLSRDLGIRLGAFVSLGVEIDAEETESCADVRADGSGVLTDSGSEDERVEAAERHSHRTDGCRHAVGEDLQSEPRRGIVRALELPDIG